MKKTFAVVEGGAMVGRRPVPKDQNTAPDANIIKSGIDFKYSLSLL